MCVSDFQNACKLEGCFSGKACISNSNEQNQLQEQTWEQHALDRGSGPLETSTPA